MPDGSRRGPWKDHQMIDHACPECGGEFGSVSHVTVGTDPKGYTPVFGGPVVLDIGRCNTCNISLERVDGGPWGRQSGQ